MPIYNKKLKERARDLRNSMTQEELILWSRIKNKQINNSIFYRQRPIGNYIVDFFCPKHKLIIELDGSQHYSNDGLEYDLERDNYLSKSGYLVKRYPNNMIRK